MPPHSASFKYAPYFTAFVEAYKALWAKKPIALVPGDNASYQPPSIPQLVIVDVSGKVVFQPSLCLTHLAHGDLLLRWLQGRTFYKRK